MPALANTAHEKFCHEYLKDFNATRAYIDSGYKDTPSARNSASELIAKPDVQARLKELVGEILNDDKQQIRKIIFELQMIAFGDIRDFMDWGSIELKPDEGGDEKEHLMAKIAEMSQNQPRFFDHFVYFKDPSQLGEKGRIISEVKKGKLGTSLKLHDKLKAIELLGRYYKMWTDKLDLSSSDGTMSPRGLNDYYASLSKSES